MSAYRVQHPARYRAALAGDIPAEALCTDDRSRLLWHLFGAGMSAEDIASHTRTTAFTTARILAERPQHSPFIVHRPIPGCINNGGQEPLWKRDIA